jgi:uncharacterized membrane protein YvbJ
MIRCQACGTENPPGAEYCVKCARKLDPETQKAVVAQREAHTATGIRWSSVIITLVILIVIIAVVAALFATHVI